MSSESLGACFYNIQPPNLNLILSVPPRSSFHLYVKPLCGYGRCVYTVQGDFIHGSATVPADTPQIVQQLSYDELSIYYLTHCVIFTTASRLSCQHQV